MPTSTPKYKGDYEDVKQQGKGRQDEEGRKMTGRIRKELARACTRWTAVNKEDAEELPEHLKLKYEKLSNKLI